MEPETIKITTPSGQVLELWQFADTSKANLPVVVMGHGLGGTKEAGLAPFARAFAQAGYAAVVLDYAGWGGSEGLPRNVLNVAAQLRDFKDVISWVRDKPWFDSSRIAVWGTSFGGMHVSQLMADDHSLAAGIMQCPCVDGFKAGLMKPVLSNLRVGIYAIADTLGSYVGRDPIYINTADINDGRPSMMSALDVKDGWDRIHPQQFHEHQNEIAARSALSVSSSRPVLSVSKSKNPILVVVSEFDTVAPKAAAESVATLAPKGELVRVRGGHFDVYPGGPSHEENVQAQLAFLRRVMPVETSQSMAKL